MSNINVKSHVGRDIIQSAQLFRTPEAAVWEYVVNSLQYVDAGIVAHVKVVIDEGAKSIRISDNGQGLDGEGLEHFFTMHGENRERRKGVPGRGKFGTGKSAAFGIGSELTVSTTKNSIRQTVRLTRAAIDASDGSDVPVESLEQDAAADGEPNGTDITISGIIARLAKEPIVSLIERHLSAFRGSPVVTVNGRVCEIVRPTATLTRSFSPTPEQAAVLGDVELIVQAAAAPLDEIHRGVQVTIGVDNLVAVETAGIDTKEYGKYLFGSVDCPALDLEEPGRPAAYTNDRSMKLNPANPVAVVLIAFIGANLEQVRQELVETGRDEKAKADRARLKETTNKIEDILNSDLKDFRERVEGLGNNRRQYTSLAGVAGGEEEHPTDVVPDPGGELVGTEDGVGEYGGGEASREPGPEPTPWTPKSPEPHGEAGVVADPDGENKVSLAGTGKPKLRGGLQIDFGYFGADYDRYRWEQDERKIVINLDHAVVKAAKELPDDEATYRRLIWEIAFTAYAVALADLQFERDPALSSSDATFEIRQALKRVWAHAGALYAV